MSKLSKKSRFRAMIFARLDKLKPIGVRSVTRGRDTIAIPQLKPGLTYIETSEFNTDLTAGVATMEFDFFIKITVNTGNTDKDNDLKDILVAAVLEVLEGFDYSPCGMTIVKAGEEKTAFTSRFTFIEGPFVRFRAQYTRTLGDPYT